MDLRAACNYYLRFAIQLIQELGVAFPAVRRDPIAIANGYIAGTVSQDVCNQEAAAWWD